MHLDRGHSGDRDVVSYKSTENAQRESQCEWLEGYGGREVRPRNLDFMSNEEPLKGFRQKSNVVRFMFRYITRVGHKGTMVDVVGLRLYSNLPLEGLPIPQLCID